MKTYADVIAYFSVRTCDGCTEDIDHRTGSVTGSTVHWTPRRLTRPGLRKFLMLVARTRVLRYNQMNRAMQIYAENAWATRASQYLHLRFPRRYSEVDRATVRWLITRGHEVSAPARSWAQRQENT